MFFRKKKLNDAFFSYHLNRLKSIKPSFRKDERVSGNDFFSIRGINEWGEKNLLENNVVRMYHLENDLLIEQAMNKDYQLSFHNIIPPIMKDLLPKKALEIQEHIEHKEKGIWKNYENQFMFSMGNEYRRILNQINTINLIHNNKHTKEELSAAAYNNVYGNLAYSHAINEKNYTLVNENTSLFLEALELGIFDNHINPKLIAKFSGSSLIEYTYFNLIEQRYNKKLPSDFIESAITPQTFFAAFLPHDEVDKIVNNNTDERIIIKNNGLTCQSPQEVEKEIQELVKLKEENPHTTFWLTIPTTYSKTTEDYYLSTAFSNVLSKEFIISDNLKTFQPEVRTQYLKEGKVIRIGEQNRQKTNLFNAYHEKPRPLKTNSFIHSQDSYRFSPEFITYLQKKYDIQVQGEFEQGSVALYSKAQASEPVTYKEAHNWKSDQEMFLSLWK